jgi:hypothetical protein
MLPRFNELKLLASAIKHKLGGLDNGSWDCRSLGHFVPPDFISKKVKQRNFRFLTECWVCRKRLLFDCAFNDNNDLVANSREYNSPTDLFRYFNDINNNDYHSMDELYSHNPPHEDDHKIFIERDKAVPRCRVCGDNCFDVSKLNLCQSHTLEALLQLKFREGITINQVINDMKNAYENGGNIPSLIVQNKMITVMQLMLNTLQGKELADFFLALPTIIQKLEVISGKKLH